MKLQLSSIVKSGILCLLIVAIAGCSANDKGNKPMKRDKMIIDQLTNSDHYLDMHPRFAKAFEFLKQENLASLPPQRYELEGDKLFASISKGPGRSRDEAKLEAHKKYIDIQYVIAGTEEMGWKRVDECTSVETPYDADKDIMFFNDAPTSWNQVPAGSFTIFFPQDAHAPLVGNGEIHKVVIKVAVD